MPICFECGAGMLAKEGTSFWVCSNCNYDIEKDFDKAVMRGFELGFDIVKMRDSQNPERNK